MFQVPVGIVHWRYHFFVCFSLKVSRIRPSSLRPRCVTSCVVSAVCWAGHLCPLPRGIRSLHLPRVLPGICSDQMCLSFLLISYFLRDFLFQIFSLVFIFTTIVLLLKCSVYLSPNDWISQCQHLRTFRGIENYCYHLNKLLSYTRICHFFIFYFLFYISLLTFLLLIDFFFG